MRLVNFEQWFNANRVNTPTVDDGSGHDKVWAGIAIGPDSKEARVVVDNHTLQAGYVLPMQATTYGIQRFRPNDANLTIFKPALGYLQVALLEPCELGFDFARPPYVDPGVQMVFAAAGQVQAYFPFAGRRAAKFFITGDQVNNNWSYSVVGYSWSYAQAGFLPPGFAALPKTLKAEAAPQAESGAYAFYIGGTDNGECWDVLQLVVTTTDAAAHKIYVDYEAYGELGRR